MRLIEARVRMFRHILDSDPVAVQPDVTCLVGKNESGKTAFLQALQRLNPARGNLKISSARQYPAWLEKKHRRTADLENFSFVEGTFELDPEEMQKLAARFGEGTLSANRFVMRRSYDGNRIVDAPTVEANAVSHVLEGSSPDLLVNHAAPTSLGELDELIASLGSDEAYESAAADAQRLSDAKDKMLGDQTSLTKAVVNALDAIAPKFFYFADYSSLPGSIKIRELLGADRNTLTDDEITALSLLELAGAEDDYLLEPDYETRKRELENVSNALTEDILDYWTTNDRIRVEIDITQTTVPEQKPVRTANGQMSTAASTSTVLDELKIRLRDDRHSLSLPFDERSTGFKWFFSFLAAFSVYEQDDKPVIILLDEPGLGLHARAQKDFLRFIDERLGAKRQVIYSTHSPFMVQPGHLDRVRLVEDKGKEKGSKVSADVLSTDRDTLFPLQGALGYDIAQHLFIAPHNLLVEGTSDLTYLTVVSRHLIENGREGLSADWSIVPVGGADMVPTFVALLGHHLDVTVIVDSRKEGHQRLERMREDGYLEKNRIITIGQLLDRRLADVEDLFALEDYVMLYNAAFTPKLKVADLKGTDPILPMIERVSGKKFDHGKPADVFLRRRDALLPKLGPVTLDRFEVLFKAVNATLGARTASGG